MSTPPDAQDPQNSNDSASMVTDAADFAKTVAEGIKGLVSGGSDAGNPQPKAQADDNKDSQNSDPGNMTSMAADMVYLIQSVTNDLKGLATSLASSPTSNALSGGASPQTPSPTADAEPNTPSADTSNIPKPGPG